MPMHQPASAGVPRVAIQGDVGSFSEAAAASHWPGELALVHCTSFAGALDLLRAGEVAAAVLPIENAVAGPVTAALAALAAAGDTIRVEGELQIPVALCLIGIETANPTTVSEAHSHPVAIAQCSRFFTTHPWICPVAHLDTAGAARDVARLGNPAVAAIASAAAADAHGLTILAHGVQDIEENWTRFVVVRSGR